MPDGHWTGEYHPGQELIVDDRSLLAVVLLSTARLILARSFGRTRVEKTALVIAVDFAVLVLSIGASWGNSQAITAGDTTLY